jgi:ArsR family transcriptional regulator, arsenate/arsenite/antimonite-responsive transcriptional repressor
LRSRGGGGTIKSMAVDLISSASTPTDSSAIACCAPLAGPTLSDAEAAATARLFGALGEPARVRILNLLATAVDPVCVCELTEPLGLSQGTVSHHLKRLTDVGLLDREEQGKWTYFSINADAMTRLSSLLDLPQGACC